MIALELHYQHILVHLLKGLVESLSIFDKNQDPTFSGLNLSMIPALLFIYAFLGDSFLEDP